MHKETFNVAILRDGTWKVRSDVRKVITKIFGKPDEDVFVEMSFIGKRKERTEGQNDYYWAVLVPIVTGCFIMNGNDLRIDRRSDLMTVHELLKDKFIPEGEMVLFDRHGTKYGIREKTTTALDTRSANKYYKDIRDWVFQCFGIQCPLPVEPTFEVADPDGNVVMMSIDEFITHIKLEYEK